MLTVHLVRFYWRRDTNSKAKIMFVPHLSFSRFLPDTDADSLLVFSLGLSDVFRRQVKFPFGACSSLLACHRLEVKNTRLTRLKSLPPPEFDALDMCTESLKAKLSPVNVALKNISKDRDERAKIRKRIRGGQPAAAAATAVVGAAAATAMAVDGAETAASSSSAVYGGTEEEERKKREEEGVALRALVDESVRADTGANASGLYELCGEPADALIMLVPFPG